MIQLVKERFDRFTQRFRFVSTEAAHSTAAFQPVKRFSKIFFSNQPLALQRRTRPPKRGR
ncbi:hypothetical protein OF001_U350001 [Pseudomonas sp. OF001]|nr:hypothetical protein OF001_U120001 [Pseudomonas sp. OF001]CAD5378688.1 hypothetical protein OF001_U350001 [Pseudomonas sp. OF001]